MKNSLGFLVLILTLLQIHLFAQQNDTIIKNKIKYFKYNLYKGVSNHNYIINGITTELRDSLWVNNNNKILDLSHQDSLLIFIGGIITTKSKLISDGSSERIPTYCFSVVISHYTHRLIQCLLFDNKEKPTVKEIPLTELEYYLKIYFENIVKFTIKQ